MTLKQAAWASHHDWYHSVAGNVWLTVSVKDYNSHGRMVLKQFTSFRELYIWAGY